MCAAQMRLLDYFFFLIQRLVFAVLIVLLNSGSQNPQHKLGLCVAMVILFTLGLLYQTILRPYTKLLWIVYGIVEQALFLVLSAVLLYF